MAETQTDAELWRRLAAEGFSGPAFDRLQMELVRFALSALPSLITSSQAIRRLRRLGIPVSGPLPATREDVQEVVSEVVVDGLRLFRQKAAEGTGWSPEGGASLTTYFLNACLLTYPNAYRRWLRRTTRQSREVATSDIPDVPVPDHLDTIVAREGLQNLLKGLNERERETAMLLAYGFSRDEIAEFTGATRRAVDGIVDRMRRRHHRLKAGWKPAD